MQIAEVRASAFRIPTDGPEADGTLHWHSTTIVVAQVSSRDGLEGIGYTYSEPAAVELIQDKLAGAVSGLDIHAPGAAWELMLAAVRNAGRPGLAASAISAVDVALWDLRARALDLPLFRLLGAHRDRVPVYGSGGFTTYDRDRLQAQLRGWVEQGIGRVKIKIGGAPLEHDVARARDARDAIGPDVELFVDANGAYRAKEAITMARRLHEETGAVYFEEPVSSDHLDELALVRREAPQQVAAGEYGYDPWYFRRLLGAQAVDVMQADATRCLGVTGWLQAAVQAYAAGVAFSAHTAPAIHAHLGCAAPSIAHLEYFHDHVRVEEIVFGGTLSPEGGCLAPDPARPGLGLEVREDAAAEYRVAA